MKTALTLLLLMSILTLSPSMHAQKTKTKAGKSVQNTVQVMYFYGERRCATCKAIEKVAMETIKDQYGSSKRVMFKGINHEEETNAALVEKYQIAGSSLIVQGPGKDFKDLTVEAFQFARNDPGKMQSLLIATVDGFLK